MNVLEVSQSTPEISGNNGALPGGHAAEFATPGIDAGKDVDHQAERQ